MPDTVTHPTLHELIAFGLGKLPEGAAAVVAAHLEICPTCRQAVANVNPDTFLGKVRDAGPQGPSFPPGLGSPGDAPSIAGRPAIPNVPCPDLPPELARHPKYLILRELGRGGMGVVYQARHKEMDRQIVIKVINRSLLDRPDTLERFRREVRAAALLSHPNIVTAYDAEQVGDAHMLVMEFVPGQSLAEVVQKKGPLPVEFACHFARQVALGLQHAHERGMVHRDIKPQNLILTLKNQVKILDFGLAKVLREESTGTGLTSHNTYLGTPEYSAPEQATDARSTDTRADLYSLGCTLYYLLAGRPPFREATVVNTILAHLQKEAQPLPELRPDVPVELWQVVKRLLAKDPGQRYQKPTEVVQALAPFVKSGAKPAAKSGPAPTAATPEKGTILVADTRQIQKVLREVPGNAPRKDIATTHMESPFEELGDTPAVPKNAQGARAARKWLTAAWWKRPAVLAPAVGVSLALIVMAVVIVKKPEDTLKKPGHDFVVQGKYEGEIKDKDKLGTRIIEPEEPDDPQIMKEAEQLNDAAWGVVKTRGAAKAGYAGALRRAEAAVCLAPKDGYILNTLGVAQYRVGRYADAVATLTKSEKLNVAKRGLLPADLAFLAMAQHRLGKKNESKATLVRLRKVMQQPRWTQDAQAEGFLREAEELIEGQAAGKEQ
ncbi:MAG TPA: protein kinase [Gemmataceae bacterium]|nr:protein kinase [Gemmataceae bacterium]